MATTCSEKHDQKSTLEGQKNIRSFNEILKRIEHHLQKSTNIHSIFSRDICVLRYRLKEYCTRLLETEPLSYGSKAIDGLWRKSFYDSIVLIKRIKNVEDWTETERCYVYSHLLSGIGYFSQILQFLNETNYGIDICELSFNGTESKGNEIQRPSTDLDIWRKNAVYRCLILLGDICRYIYVELKLVPSLSSGDCISRQFYSRALGMDQQNGLVFNQLATLTNGINYGLDSTYYYLRCVNSKITFEGGETNLMKLLKKNHEIYLNNLNLMAKKQNRSCDESGAQMEENCLRLQMILLNALLFETTDTDLSLCCQEALEAMQACLYFNVHGTNDGLDLELQQTRIILSSSTLVKIVAIFCLANHKIKATRGRQNLELVLSIIRAYLLALFCYFVTKMLTDVYLKLFGPEATNELFCPSTKQEEEEEPSDIRKNGEIAKRNGRRRPRGRKRVGHDEYDYSSSEDIVDDSLDDESDLEGSNFCDGHDYFDEILSESSEDEDKDVIVISENTVYGMLEVTRVIGSHPLLNSILLASKWLLDDGMGALAKENSDEKTNCDLLWKRLVVLFNVATLESYEESVIVSSCLPVCKAQIKSRSLSDSGKRFSVDETDRIFAYHNNSDSCDNDGDRNNIQHQLMGLLQLLAFRDDLCANFSSQVGFKIDVDSNTVFQIENDLKSLDQKNGSQTKQDIKSSHNAEDKNDIMTNMARLWLQDEIKNLEKTSRSISFEKHRNSDAFHHYSPYVVVDHMVLINHLNLVKHILAMKQFAFIVPSAVIQELDSMKRLNKGARKVIRWLELQFRQGNRWLRAQRSNEFRTLDSFGIIQAKAETLYIKIVECCSHFAQLGSSRHSTKQRNKGFVTLLTSSKTDFLTYQAAFKNVCVENIHHFLRKQQNLTRRIRSNIGSG